MPNSSQTPDLRSQPVHRRASRLAAILAGGGALVWAALTPRTPEASPAPASVPTPVRTLEVVATEFALQAPDTVTAGRVRLRLTNHGRELHILEVVRLADGHTTEELAAILAARKPAPAWATFVGGPIAPPKGAPAGGGASDAPTSSLDVTVDLEPGRYALICPIPSPDDHRPHMVKGMVRTLVVVPASPSGAALPSVEEHEEDPIIVGRDAGGASAARVVLDDYGFLLQPEWQAGRHEIRVVNRAAQPHEMVVFKLDAGKRVADVVSWAASLTGPPPGTLVAGTTALGRGRAATIDLTLTPGAYALLCFAPDAKDGRSHVQHGMTREVTVE